MTSFHEFDQSRLDYDYSIAFQMWDPFQKYRILKKTLNYSRRNNNWRGRLRRRCSQFTVVLTRDLLATCQQSNFKKLSLKISTSICSINSNKSEVFTVVLTPDLPHGTVPMSCSDSRETKSAAICRRCRTLERCQEGGHVSKQL